MPLIDVSEISKHISFERLSSLSIEDCSLNEEVLFAFMRRHSRHLKLLKAVRLNMVGESTSWRSTIQRIAPVMSLDIADLRLVLDDEAMTIEDDRKTVQSNKQVSLYLELNGPVEYGTHL